MTRLLAILNSNQDAVMEQWGIAVEQSIDYARALKVENKEYKLMEAQGIVLYVQTSAGSCLVFVKHVCTQSGWQDVLQSRLVEAKQYSTGDGTTHFTTLPENIHQEVVRALAADKFDIRKNESVRP